MDPAPEALVMHEAKDKSDDQEQMPPATTEALRKLIAEEQNKDEALKAIIESIKTAKVVMEQLRQSLPAQE